MPGLAASRHTACISATTFPARRILASSSGVRLTLGSPQPVAVPAVVDGADQPGGHHIRGAHAVHLHQLVALQVPRDERRGLLLVQLEAPPNRSLGVVLSL